MRFRASATSDPERWAFTPDLNEPKTWRVPLCDREGEYDSRKIAAAIGCLSPDAQPVISPKDMRIARHRITTAYVAVHGVEASLPRVLCKTFDPSPVDEEGELRGVMIAFAPDTLTAELLAVPGGLPVEELHVTLAYLGSMADYTPQDLDDLCAVVRRFAAGASRPEAEGIYFPEFVVEGETTGFAVLVGDDEAAAVALVDCPGLQKFRARLVDTLNEYGFYPRSNHDYLPHITLAYGQPDQLQTIPVPPKAPVGFDTLLVCWPGVVTEVPLDGSRLSLRGTFVVKSEEQRYTLAPLYVPEAVDSHGEWASLSDIEAGVIGYMDRGCFDINWQHVEDTRAGRCVGIITWPLPVETTLVAGDGTATTVTLPPGTVYQAVVWEPWAWQMVKDGKINALSMEGWAMRKKETIDG